MGDIVNQKLELERDKIHRAPTGFGNGESPGPVVVTPGRALVDLRFNQFPATYRCLALCCSYACSHTGVFFPNQSTMAKQLQVCQQTISHHMRKLVEWGYVQKLIKEYPLRQNARKGATWRVLFDPDRDLKEILSTLPADKRPEWLDEAEANKTLAAMTSKRPIAKRGNKTADAAIKQVKAALGISEPAKGFSSPEKLVKETVNKLVDNSSLTTSATYPNAYNQVEKKPSVTHPSTYQSTHSNTCITNQYNYNKNPKNEIVDKLIYEYARLCEQVYRQPWHQDQKQRHFAAQLADKGITVDWFRGTARDILQTRLSKGSPPPQSLAYFVKVYEDV